jgi:hypothetical protein
MDVLTLNIELQLRIEESGRPRKSMRQRKKNIKHAVIHNNSHLNSRLECTHGKLRLLDKPGTVLRLLSHEAYCKRNHESHVFMGRRRRRRQYLVCMNNSLSF